jgi:hypothetical protein
VSLDDKFYPEDGTLITRADNALIRAAGKIGEAYQQLTGRSYKDLYKFSMECARHLAVISSIPLNPAGLISAWKFKSMHDNPIYESPLEERMRRKAGGEYGWTGASERLGAVVLLPAAAAGIIYGSMQQFSSGFEQKEIPAYAFYAGLALASLSWLPATFADYLSKADVPKPPEKHGFGRTWDRMKARLPTWEQTPEYV